MSVPAPPIEAPPIEAPRIEAPLVETSGLTVRRGGRVVLAGLDLRLAGPGLVAVIGPNGSGKSTLLEALAGLARPEAGAVRIGGREIARLAPAELAVLRAFLPQSPPLDWPLTVERVVALGLHADPLARGAVTARVAATLKALDLRGFAGRRLDSLSGGERARVMLASTLVGARAVVLCDEPAAGLDPGQARAALASLGQTAAGGALVVVSLHDVTLLDAGFDRVVVLRDGAVLADGPPAQVLDPDLLCTLYGLTPAQARRLLGAAPGGC